MAKLSVITLNLVLVIGVLAWIANAEVPKRPQLDADEWWGPEDIKFQANTTIRPFKIKFREEMISDLKYRLKNNRATVPPLAGVGFKYGFNQQELKPWVKYWTEKYNFEQREKFLNKFPQYKTNIQGLDIHFIWVKPRVSAGVTTIPLLLLHGWPGSVREFYETIPLLATPTDGVTFELIVPSLPGFGFSDGAVRPGLGVAQTGVIFKNLMNRLGYEKFYIQGGDWGAFIGSAMATMFQDEVLGLHSNQLMEMSSGTEIQNIVAGLMASMQLKSNAVDSLWAAIVEETGYLHLFATKPDTVGAALSDSPVGLLACILEKFSTWTRIENRELADGGLSTHFSKDQLLDNLMIYWMTNSITTSTRMYAEYFSNKHRLLNMDEYPTSVPVCSIQPVKDQIFYQTPSMLKYPNLLEITKLDGGHFIAFELPKLFAEDIFKAEKTFRKFHKTETGMFQLYDYSSFR